jgi:hypothetical protein
MIFRSEEVKIPLSSWVARIGNFSAEPSEEKIEAAWSSHEHEGQGRESTFPQADFLL